MCNCTGGYTGTNCEIQGKYVKIFCPFYPFRVYLTSYSKLNYFFFFSLLSLTIFTLFLQTCILVECLSFLKLKIWFNGVAPIDGILKKTSSSGFKRSIEVNENNFTILIKYFILI